MVNLGYFQNLHGIYELLFVPASPESLFYVVNITFSNVSFLWGNPNKRDISRHLWRFHRALKLNRCQALYRVGVTLHKAN